MPPKSYNFFGLGPGQMDASQSPQALAQAMALQEFNNPTSSQTQPSQSGGSSINPQMLAKMMMKNDQTGVSPEAQAQGVPANAISYSLKGAPLPWLQPPLPWSGGNG